MFFEFTNKDVIKAFDDSGLLWLRDRAEDVDPAEVADQTDAQRALDTVEYELYWYSQSGEEPCESLRWAKKLLKRTDDGKCIPFSILTLEPLEGFYPSDIQEARDVIAEYNSMKALAKRLNAIRRRELA